MTPEILSELQAHIVRTGKGPSAIQRGHPGRPVGLNGAVIMRWLDGEVKTIPAGHLDYILQCYTNPDRSDRVSITSVMREEIRAHVLRTGFGPCAVLAGRKSKPDGLSSSTIQNWIRGIASTARADHLSYVLACWRALPDANDRPRPRQLTAAQKRYAALQHRPLKPHRPQAGGFERQHDSGLDARPLAHSPEGSPRLHIEKVADTKGGGQHRRKKQRIPLTAEMIAALHAEQKRTGVSVLKLVTDHLDPQRGASRELIYTWMRETAATVCPYRYAHVIETWRSLPDHDDAYSVSTPEVRAALAAEIKRIGISVRNFPSILTDLPPGLTVNQIKSFYDGQLKRLPRAHADYILNRLKAIPRQTADSLPLTPGILSTLREHAARTDKSSYALLRGARDKPDGLRASIIQSWLFGKTTTARTDHLAYVLQRYEALSDAG